ncbi:MAG: UDP-N-acetylmuramoyl-L-alanine--D-glutamate ligase [Streptosporangiaceae bacterium]
MTPATGRTDAWAGRRVCVAGIGVSGAAAARALLRLGAKVTVVDARDRHEERAAAAPLRDLGAVVRLGDGDSLPDGADSVVTSPGWRPTAPLLSAAVTAGLPVIGEVELAWRLRGTDAAPWLAVTGTNGKTTTVEMLASILRAAGHHTVAAGNVGAPVVDAVLAEAAYDVLAVELSSFQLHWSPSVRPLAGVVLNVAPDHLDWHGSMEAYAADKARIYHADATNVYNADDPWSVRLATSFPEVVGFTLGGPEVGCLGVEDGALVDRAFAASTGKSRVDDRVRLAGVRDVRPRGPHNIADALAAAALARAYGVAAGAVRDGLQAFEPGAHRIAEVSTAAGVRYVDDSKATNPHAAAASLAAYPSVVWIAGGQLKGADIDGLVRDVAPRLRAAVLLGVDREQIRKALARHASNVPVVEVSATDTGAMACVVREAARLARPGDTVLLAPSGASFDMFASYAARGDAFAAAVRGLTEAER